MDYESFSKKYLASRPMGHGGHSLLARGMYHLQLRPFVEVSRQIVWLLFALLMSIQYFIDIPPEEAVDGLKYRRYQGISREGDVHVFHDRMPLEYLIVLLYQIQETMNHVFSFLGVPSDDIADTEAKNTRSYNIMSPEVSITSIILLNNMYRHLGM